MLYARIDSNLILIMELEPPLKLCSLLSPWLKDIYLKQLCACTLYTTRQSLRFGGVITILVQNGTTSYPSSKLSILA